MKDKHNKSPIFYYGACGESFSSFDGLDLHLEGCVYAKLFLHHYHLAILGVDKGHARGRFPHLVKRARSLIERYVRAVVYGMNSIDRASLHFEVCDALEIKHSEFKPFEDSRILSTPTFGEALSFFLDSFESIYFEKQL